MNNSTKSKTIGMVSIISYFATLAFIACLIFLQHKRVESMKESRYKSQTITISDCTIVTDSQGKIQSITCKQDSTNQKFIKRWRK